MKGARKTAGMRKKTDLMKSLEVLTFLIKFHAASVRSSVSYLATIILLVQRCLQGVVVFLGLSVQLSTPGGGGWRGCGGCRT